MQPTRFENLWFKLFGVYPASYQHRKYLMEQAIWHKHYGRLMVWNGGVYKVTGIWEKRLRLTQVNPSARKGGGVFNISLEGKSLTEQGNLLALSS